MKKADWIMTMVTLAISAALFQEELVAIFRAKNPLETMQSIAGFALHALWITILGYVVRLLPEFANPWLKTFQWKRRAERRGRHGGDGRWQSGPNAYWGRAGYSQGSKMTVRDMIALLPHLQLTGQAGQPPRLDLSQFRLEEDEPGDLDIEI